MTGSRNGTRKQGAQPPTSQGNLASSTNCDTQSRIADTNLKYPHGNGPSIPFVSDSRSCYGLGCVQTSDLHSLKLCCRCALSMASPSQMFCCTVPQMRIFKKTIRLLAICWDHQSTILGATAPVLVADHVNSSNLKSRV